PFALSLHRTTQQTGLDWICMSTRRNSRESQVKLPFTFYLALGLGCHHGAAGGRSSRYGRPSIHTHWLSQRGKKSLACLTTLGTQCLLGPDSENSSGRQYDGLRLGCLHRWRWGSSIRSSGHRLRLNRRLVIDASDSGLG